MKKGFWILGALFLTSTAAAQEELHMTIADHRFEPSELTVPSGKKFKLLVENLDNSAEEFESHDLNREKVIGPKGKATIFLGPLKPGVYKFFGEFHPETAQGVLKVKE